MNKRQKKKKEKVAFKAKIWVYPISGGDGSVGIYVYGDEATYNKAVEIEEDNGEAFTESGQEVTLKFNKAGKLLNPDELPERWTNGEEEEEDQTQEVSGPRRFEYIKKGSKKFWEISTVDSDRYMTKFGRIGSIGQTAIGPTFLAESARDEAMEALIAQKLKKGYKEVA